MTCRWVIPILFFLFNIDGSYCQSKWVIRGEVDNFKDNKEDYFNVSLLSAKDSAFIDGGTFTNGIFNIELKNIEEKQFILRINSVEYAAKDTVVYIEDSYTDVGVFI